MKNIFIATVFLASSIGLTISSHAAQQGGGSASEMDSEKLQKCPMMVPGAEVAVADVQDGVALMFTTKSGDVNELRKRVEMLAKMHNQPVKDVPGYNTTSQMMPAGTKYEMVPNGARLIFTPKDVGQMEMLRKQVREHADRYANHDCSMMPNMMREAPLPEPEESEELIAQDLGSIQR